MPTVTARPTRRRTRSTGVMVALTLSITMAWVPPATMARAEGRPPTAIGWPGRRVRRSTGTMVPETEAATHAVRRSGVTSMPRGPNPARTVPPGTVIGSAAWAPTQTTMRVPWFVGAGPEAPPLGAPDDPDEQAARAAPATTSPAAAATSAVARRLHATRRTGGGSITGARR